MIKTIVGGISWIDPSNTINGSKTTKETNDKLHSSICNHLQVVSSPLKNDHGNIRDHKTCEVIKKQKLLIKIKIRELQTDLIKPSSEGGFLVQYHNLVR